MERSIRSGCNHPLFFEVRLHRSLQYFTFSQSRAHFLRHVNGRLQTGQTFSGRPFRDVGLVDIRLSFPGLPDARASSIRVDAPAPRPLLDIFRPPINPSSIQPFFPSTRPPFNPSPHQPVLHLTFLPVNPSSIQPFASSNRPPFNPSPHQTVIPSTRRPFTGVLIRTLLIQA